MTQDFLHRAEQLAVDLAAWVIVRLRGSRVSMTSTKQNEADFVTDIDLSIEMRVRREIEAAFPEHGFTGEEFGSRPVDGYTWYCDPIDGTTNFVATIPWCSFSLALCDEDGPLIGVVADPRTGEIFSAVRGRGAQLGGRQLTITPRSALPGSVVLTELLGSRPWPGMFEFIEKLGQNYSTTRIMGSSTLTVTGLSAGRGHAAVIGQFGAVDLLAGVLIAHEAGLVVLDEEGRETLFPRSGGILVSHPGLAEQLHELWRPRARVSSTVDA